MTNYTELVSKVKKMSKAEKLALLRVLVDSLDQELRQDYRNYLSEKYK